MRCSMSSQDKKTELALGRAQERAEEDWKESHLTLAAAIEDYSRKTRVLTRATLRLTGEVLGE